MKKSYQILLVIGLILFLIVLKPQNNAENKTIYGIGIHGSHYKDTQGMKDLGVSMIRDDLVWSSVERKKGIYNFTDYDIKVEKLLNKSISPLFILDYTNTVWAPQRLNTFAYVDCSEPAWSNLKEGFSKFAYESALHYKGKVKYFEIWNEPNYHFCSDTIDGTVGNTLKYAELMKEAYIQIKKANPDAIVVSGGTGTFTGLIPNFYMTLYQYQYNKYFDILGTHPYCFATNPPADSECNTLKNLAEIKKIMDMYGDKDKKIWITETGIPSYGCTMSTTDNCNNIWNTTAGEYKCCPKNLSMQNQAIHLKATYDIIQEKYPYVEAIFWYDYMEDINQNVNSVENHFGITMDNLTRKPAWYEYKNLIQEGK